ncbi:MAG: hypothetical protein JSS65_08210 [Armatimonadetes bacterium]|nr:hypothetical protein [Armatimonadota bacterium]
MKSAGPCVLVLLAVAGCADRSLEYLPDKPTTHFTIDATTSPLVVSQADGLVTLRVTNNTGKTVQIGGTCDYIDDTMWYLFDSWGQPVSRTAEGLKHLTERRQTACTANAILMVPAHGSTTIRSWVLKSDFQLSPGDYTLRMTYKTAALKIVSQAISIKVVS